MSHVVCAASSSGDGGQIAAKGRAPPLRNGNCRVAKPAPCIASLPVLPEGVVDAAARRRAGWGVVTICLLGRCGRSSAASITEMGCHEYLWNYTKRCCKCLLIIPRYLLSALCCFVQCKCADACGGCCPCCIRCPCKWCKIHCQPVEIQLWEREPVDPQDILRQLTYAAYANETSAMRLLLQLQGPGTAIEDLECFPVRVRYAARGSGGGVTYPACARPPPPPAPTNAALSLCSFAAALCRWTQWTPMGAQP
jgi:hypothetical protein